MAQPNSDSNQTGAHVPLPGPNEDTGGALPPGRVPLPPGQPRRIGRFEVRAVLGSGAFGQVYRGFDPELQRDVAIKVPHRERLTPQFRERFLREARATATIHHANVCPVHEVGTDGELPFIVMHFVHGSTLAGLLERRGSPFPPKQAALVVRKLALGVAAAHDKGVIHRDLKPQNVLWDEANREVLVTDFGLARIGDTEMTAEGVTLGTPAYMAPEQARGNQTEVGPLSDVYSLGVILYRIVTGVLPFQGSTLEVMAQAQFSDPVPPSEVRPELDPQFDVICLKAMAKKPGDRYPSARELAVVLTGYLRAGERAADSVSEEALRLPSEPPKGSGVRPTATGSGEDRSTDVAVVTNVAPPKRPAVRPTTAAKPRWESVEDDEPQPVRTRRRAKKGPGRGVVILGGVLLFAISVLVGGLLVADGKKPSGETAQVGEKEKKDGATGAAKVDAPKDPGKQPDKMAEPKDPGKQPDKAPDPPAPNPPALNPPAPNPAPAPAPPANAGDPPVLKHRWVSNIDPELALATVAFDREAKAVVVASTNREADVAALRTKDGSAAPSFPFPFPTSVRRLLPMTNGRMGANGFARNEVIVWDVLTGKRVAAVPFPPLPEAPPGVMKIGGFNRGAISPDGRYLVAAGSGWYQGPDRTVRVGGPTRVIDLTTNKTVVTTDAHDPSFYFTADSARLLIAESVGRFRWFKLPAGTADGEFKLPQSEEADPEMYNRTIAVAGNGGVILYAGPTPDRVKGVHTLDGRTGKVLHTFHRDYHYMHGEVSDDGRRLVLVRSPFRGNRGNGAVLDVLDSHSGARVARANPSGDPKLSYALPAISPDGRSLAAVYGTQVFLYDLPAGGAAVDARPPEAGATEFP